MDEDDVVEFTQEVHLSSAQQEYDYKNHVWDQEMTFSLIDEYRNHLQDFLYPQGQMIRDVWENISYNMRMRGYDLTAIACDNKWRQLKKTFRYNQPHGGRKSLSKWIYYEALEDILGNKDIARRLVWKQRSTIKREHEDPGSPSYTQEENEDEYVEDDEGPSSTKKCKIDEPPKWFENFLTRYQEEEKQKRKLLEKMHTDLVAMEKQKCVLLENLIKKMSKTENVPKIVDAVSLSQEVFEDEL